MKHTFILTTPDPEDLWLDISNELPVLMSGNSEVDFNHSCSYADYLNLDLSNLCNLDTLKDIISEFLTSNHKIKVSDRIYFKELGFSTNLVIEGTQSNYTSEIEPDVNWLSNDISSLIDLANTNGYSGDSNFSRPTRIKSYSNESGNLTVQESVGTFSRDVNMDITNTQIELFSDLNKVWSSISNIPLDSRSIEFDNNSGYTYVVNYCDPDTGSFNYVTCDLLYELMDGSLNKISVKFEITNIISKSDPTQNIQVVYYKLEKGDVLRVFWNPISIKSARFNNIKLIKDEL